MPATDSELASMEGPHVLENKEGALTGILSSDPPATVPSSPPLVPTTMRPNFTSETEVEAKAVSMASNDCSSSLSSPAEASPAKPAVTPPTTPDGTLETSPATSHIASASDSLTSTGTSLISISETPPSLPVLPSTTFGTPDPDTNFPPVLTFKGVSVTLENNTVWNQFNRCGTEMILTKQGRRMFPYCRYRLAGLDPDRRYSLVLSIVPSDSYRYRWSTSKWEVSGPAEHQGQGLIRAFSHHYSPCRGSDWMGSLISFYKLKLTNNSQDLEGHIILHSMHRYIPRLHVIPVPDGDVATFEKPVVMGPESMTFTFPQTEFMAVTTYQNFRITQLKINHNPFAKGFREDGNNSRLNRIPSAAQPVMMSDTQAPAPQPAPVDEIKEGVVIQSEKIHPVSASPSNEKQTRLVLKPIMSAASSKDDAYVPCIRGKHALGELVLVETSPKKETHDISVTPKAPTAMSKTPTSAASTPRSSPGYRRKKKRVNRRWANSRGREWKAATASPTVVHSPSLTVAMQPELDDVEGLLFVSFSSKEALEVHVRDMPTNNSTSASPASPTAQTQSKQTAEVILETEEEKLARLQGVLLQDLTVLKHRQVIHPVLQEVGMKLSSLDPTKSIDMQYLGVRLPLPPPKLPEQDASPGDEGLPFISRTGKTSDMTKIKGWRNKFIRSKERSPSNGDGSQKNLSAFCSNMLDEYLESEAQYISERAAAFSTNPEGSVAYQLPAKSSSYVKTLDSVLKHRKTASKVSVGSNKPCPLSHKPPPLLCPPSSTPAHTSPASPAQAGAQSMQQSAAPCEQSGAAVIANAAPGSSYASSASQRLSTNHSGVSQRSVSSSWQSPGTSNRHSGLTKFQFKLLLMEIASLNEGLNRTQLTEDRLNVALSVLLTKEMQASQLLKVSRCPKKKADQPECGKDFCRLGCVCSSLMHLSTGPLHCRQPECMFGCGCFKRTIAKQLTAGETEPVHSMINVQHTIQPHPGSNKLWRRSINDVDVEPLFAPVSAPLSPTPAKVMKRSSTSRPSQPIREEDKDPVYKYLESMMTCARVREFNSKPPPVVTIEPKPAKPEKTTTDVLPKAYYRSLLTVKKADKEPENTAQSTTSCETTVKRQMEIQSGCQWTKDRKKVLEALFRRMNQDRLCQSFNIGPYCIRPVAKIFMQKPSGALITYRVHISKPSDASGDDEDEFDDSDEEKHTAKSHDEEMEAEEEGGEAEELVMRFGVTPFQRGVLPAGKLRARTKPDGVQACGLIQVNGKSYNQARLLLGNMGALHPANRLAAYVTGRLHMPADISVKTTPISDPVNKIVPPGTLKIKAAGMVVPPMITARKTTELKTLTQPPVQPTQPDSWRKGSITLPQHSPSSLTINPVHMFISGQHSSFQTSSTSSPVSLTVSPSLKTPSFLGQSGTYSFRICPPANQGTKDQKLPGVILPGGFTLIQLPKHGADGAAQHSESVAAVDKAPPPKDALSNFGHLAADSEANWLGLDTITQVKALLSSRAVQPGSSSGPMCDKRMPADESSEASIRQTNSNLDIPSEDLSSDSSDYSGDGDEDEEMVDIETVEEASQRMAISKMKEAARKTLMETRDCRHDFGPARDQQSPQAEYGDSKLKRKRKNHTVLERQRRSDQRVLFDKLQTILQTDPRVPRLRLLSLALKEIQNLVETSRFLEEKKRRLIQRQALYMKELFLLSGKTDKLKETCEQQKVREKMIFSHLLQSRAAFLQASNPEPEPEPEQDHDPMPWLEPDFFMTRSQAVPYRTTAHSSVDKTSTAFSLPVAVPSVARANVIVPSPRAEDQPSGPGVPVQVSMSNSPASQPPPVTATLQVTMAQNEASPMSSAPNSTKLSAPVQPSISLPLIRSKTGRIILPSSLKPTHKGFYTFMVMNPKQEGEDGEVNMQPSDADSSKSRDNTPFKPDHPSERRPTLKEDRAVKSSNSKPKHSGVKAPLAELALLNKSIFVPLVPHKTTEKILGVNQAQEPDKSPTVVRRGRGRPRKDQPVAATTNGKPTVAEDSSRSVSESETSVLVDKRQNKKINSEVAKRTSATVHSHPVPVKRGRGRPPKTMPKQVWSPSAMEDSPVRPSSRLKSPDTMPKASPSMTSVVADMNTSRPLTRGALGKDFPSAKKRSWIDIERELEPEVESE